jgi:hypothetical protein
MLLDRSRGLDMVLDLEVMGTYLWFSRSALQAL